MTYRGMTGLVAKLEAGDAVGGLGQRMPESINSDDNPNAGLR